MADSRMETHQVKGK